MAGRHGADTIDSDAVQDVVAELRERTGGRGPDCVVDAVGMEAHGAPVAKAAQKVAGVLPDALARPLFTKAGIDPMSVVHAAIAAVRRGGTISLSGVYGGMVDPMPMMDLFDKQLQLRMGQANVRRWTDDLLPLVSGEDDPLGVEDLTTHRLPLSEAPRAYEMFQKKEDGAVKVVFQP